ncbi:hypothetical protein J2T17_000737 [Paenibacillus mucilaginosus]
MAGITDEGSLEKLRRFVRPGSVTRLELNFLCGTDRRPQLFELHQQWEEESAAAHLLLCPLCRTGFSACRTRWSSCAGICAGRVERRRRASAR